MGCFGLGGVELNLTAVVLNLFSFHRINLTPLHGLYFTEQGVVKMHWQWRDYAYHVHAPPYNSISLKLSPFISIHIISRDQVYVTFKRMKRRIRFNVGAKLVVSVLVCLMSKNIPLSPVMSVGISNAICHSGGSTQPNRWSCAEI